MPLIYTKYATEKNSRRKKNRFIRSVTFQEQDRIRSYPKGDTGLFA